jgi:hypothetical protein
MYADDSKIFRSLSKSATLANGMQDDLNSLFSWCDAWQLSVNVNKCSVLKLGLRRQRDVGTDSYRFANLEIPIESIVKDLGIYVSSSLNFSQHCNIV